VIEREEDNFRHRKEKNFHNCCCQPHQQSSDQFETMGNYASTATSTGFQSTNLYQQHEPSLAPIFDSHMMIFETNSLYASWNNSTTPTPNGNDTPSRLSTSRSEDDYSDGTVFLGLGNYQYGQLLHKRKRDILVNMPSDICMETFCHPLQQNNGVRCSNQNIRMIECGIAQTILVTIDNLVYGTL